MNSFEAQLEAARRLAKWMDEAIDLRSFHVANRLTVPAVIDDLFEPRSTPQPQPDFPTQKPKLVAPREILRRNRVARSFPYNLPESPKYGVPPKGAEGWVAVPMAQASPYNLIKALLSDYPNRSSSFLNAELARRRGVEGGSGYNVLKKLQEEQYIDGDTSEWRVVKPLNARLSDERLWVPDHDLSDRDKAAVRREVVIGALSVNPRMTTTAIVRCLGDCKWLKTQVNSDLLKGDLREMRRQKKIDRIEETKEWCLKGSNEKEVPPIEKTS